MHSPVSAFANRGDAVLEGRVVNAITRDPIPRAAVVLQGMGETLLTVTDHSGFFAWKDLKPGSYELSAHHDGFLLAGHGSRVVLENGHKPADPKLELVPQSVIAGRVTGEDDEPLANSLVTIFGLAARAGEPVVMGRAFTDDLGQYRIHTLPSGKYYLQAIYGERGANASQLKNSRNIDLEAENGYAPSYYPGVLRFKEASVVDVKPGSVTANTDIVLRRAPRLRVRGRVLLPTSTHVHPRSMLLSIMRTDPLTGSVFQPLTVPVEGASGTFEIGGITPGSYVLSADWADGTKRYSGRQSLDLDLDGVDNLVVTLTPEARVLGRVRADPSAGLDYSSLRISIEGRSAEAQSGKVHSAVDASGSFILEGLRPDHYALKVDGLEKNFYIQSVSLGGKELASFSDLDLSHGLSLSLAITVSPGAG